MGLVPQPPARVASAPGSMLFERHAIVLRPVAERQLRRTCAGASIGFVFQDPDVTALNPVF